MTCSALLRSSRYALAGAIDGELTGCVDALAGGDAVGDALALAGALGVGLAPCGVAPHANVSAATRAATEAATLGVFSSTMPPSLFLRLSRARATWSPVRPVRPPTTARSRRPPPSHLGPS